MLLLDSVQRKKSVELVTFAVTQEEAIAIVVQLRRDEGDPGAGDLYTVGTGARVLKWLKLGGDDHSIVVEGLRRRRPGPPTENPWKSRPLIWRALEDLNLWPSDS